MKELKRTGQIDAQDRLVLEHLPQPLGSSGRVEVVLLYPDEDGEGMDPDDTSIEEVEAGLRRALQQIQAGERIPLAKIWEILAEDDTEVEAS